MLQYIHFNRHQNSLLINDLKKQIETHHSLHPSPSPAPTPASNPTPSTTPTPSSSPPPSSPPPPPVPGQVVVLVRKEVSKLLSNTADYFDKTFAEYEEGFQSKGTIGETTIA